MRPGYKKQRSASCYAHKVDKVTKWYHNLVKIRSRLPKLDLKTGLPYPSKPLLSLDSYINKIKKPTGGK
jgi:hypothetical protein